MRSEHPTTGDEWDAFTKWRRFLHWKPGERKKIKKMSHQRDRRAISQELRDKVRNPLIAGQERLDLINEDPEAYYEAAMEYAREMIVGDDE